jgi:hypothetical protein
MANETRLSVSDEELILVWWHVKKKTPIRLPSKTMLWLEWMAVSSRAARNLTDPVSPPLILNRNHRSSSALSVYICGVENT